MQRTNAVHKLCETYRESKAEIFELVPIGGCKIET